MKVAIINLRNAIQAGSKAINHAAWRWNLASVSLIYEMQFKPEARQLIMQHGDGIWLVYISGVG